MLLEKSGECVTLKCLKMKDAPEFEPMSFEPVVVDIETTDPERPDTSIFLNEVAPVKQQAKVKPLSGHNLTALKALETVHEGKSSVHLEEWRKEFYARCPADDQGTKQKAFRRALTDLVEKEGLVCCRDDQYWIFTVPGQPDITQTNPNIV